MIAIIQKRLDEYHAASALQEEQATKEIIQEVALYALWRSGLFEIAAFQGGTSLRILHKLPRFSEDLDFMLKEPDAAFVWSSHLEALKSTFEEFGLNSEATPRGGMDKRIRQAVIKDNSIAQQLNLSFREGHPERKLKIKLEIDVEPPAASGYEYTFLDFPLDFEVCHQDLPSNFALKLHALLCRGFLKGRDWFDFAWYVREKTPPNLKHLENALKQFGPWAGNQSLSVDRDWLVAALADKIRTINWKEAAEDVRRFLPATEQKSLELWSERFFMAKVDSVQ